MEVNINLIVAIIGGTITISSFFITRYLERKRHIENEIRNKKIPIFEEFFDFYFNVIHGDKSGKKINEEDMIKFFRDFNRKAIIWFPNNVLKAYIIWKTKLQEYSSSNNNDYLFKELLVIQEDFMKEMRKDIGHNNKKLRKGDILSLFINDVKNIIK